MGVFLALLWLYDPSAQSSEFWSTIVGAIVGGSIACLIQIKALREGRRDRNEDRLRVQKGLANSLLFKMFRIQSNLRLIHQHHEECIEKSREKMPSECELWQRIQPMGKPPKMQFTAEEMTMLLEQKDNDVFNSALSTNESHNAIVEMVALYKEERRKLTDQFPPPVAHDGQHFFGFYTREKLMELGPQMVDVNSIAEQVQGYAADATERADALLPRLVGLLRDRGLVKYKTELKPADIAPRERSAGGRA